MTDRRRFAETVEKCRQVKGATEDDYLEKLSISL